MKNIMNHCGQKLRAGRRKAYRATALLLVLSILGSMGCPGAFVALAAETRCELEEHTHTEDCYEQVLVCGLEEDENHTHTDDCYEPQLICGLEEHTHTDACYVGEADADTSGAQAEDEADTDASQEQTGDEADEDASQAQAEADADADTAAEQAEDETDTGTAKKSTPKEASDDSEEQTENNVAVSAASLDEEDESNTSADEGSVSVTALESTSSESIVYALSDCEYDASTGNFDINVELDFTFNQVASDSDYYKGTYDTSIVTTEGYTVAYEIALPEGFIVPSDLLGKAYNGYDADSAKQLLFR